MKSEQAIIQALHKAGGNIALSAQMLGMARRSLCERIEKSKVLQQTVETERETLIDIAERNVRKAVLEGSIDDSWKVLRTVGRRRGYVERDEVEIKTDNISITCGIKPVNNDSD